MTGLLRSARRPSALLLIVAVAVLVLGWWSKAYCVTGDGRWQGGQQFTGGCYTDAVALWRERGLVAGSVPYLDAPVEYPVLTGVQMWVQAEVTRALVGEGDHAFAFLTVTAVWNGALLLATLWWLWRMGVPRRRLWWFAAAPPIVLYMGHNWDPAAVLLLVGSIGLHLRGRDGWAGVAAGLGTAAKLFPGIVIPLVMATRLAQRRPRAALLHAGTAALAWLAVNLPVAVAAPDNWWRFYEMSRSRGATFASTWSVLEWALAWSPTAGERNLVSAVAFLIGAGVIAAVGWRRHRTRMWVLAGPLLCWFLLTNKVFSPQFDLWLVPLLVLTLPRLRQYVAFVATDVAVYVTEFGYLGMRAEGIGNPYWVLAAAATLRAAVLVWLVVAILRGPPPLPVAEPLPAGGGRLADMFTIMVARHRGRPSGAAQPGTLNQGVVGGAVVGGAVPTGPHTA